MKTLYRLRRPAAVSLTLAFALGIGAAAAQDVRTQIEDIHQQYETAMEQGDAAAVAAFYTDDAVYHDPEGKTLQGRAAIEEYYKALPKFEDVEITTSNVDQLGDVIIDIGSYADKLAAEAGGQTLEGEYVVIARNTDQGIKIYRIVLFPKRQPMTAQQ